MPLPRIIQSLRGYQKYVDIERDIIDVYCDDVSHSEMIKSIGSMIRCAPKSHIQAHLYV